jgi:hypothetical protein
MELINEASRYFEQYKADGEYDKILGGKTGDRVPLKIDRNCSVCGKESDKMKVCMDSRQLHRYVCSSKCMIKFYE